MAGKVMDEVGLAALWEIIGEKFGRVVMGSYAGTGEYGSSNPNTLTFDFEPKAIIFPDQEGMGSSYYIYGDVVWVRGQAQGRSCLKVSSGGDLYPNDCNLAWSGNTVSWYSDSSDINYAPSYQLNKSGVTYTYIAIGCKE